MGASMTVCQTGDIAHWTESQSLDVAVVHSRVAWRRQHERKFSSVKE